MKKLFFFVVLFLPLIAMAESMPNVLYVDEGASECGYIWGGDEYVEYEPVDSRWEEERLLIDSPSDPVEACAELDLNYVGELESIGNYTDLGKDLLGDYGDVDDENYFWYWVSGLIVLVGVGFVIKWRK